MPRGDSGILAALAGLAALLVVFGEGLMIGALGFYPQEQRYQPYHEANEQELHTGTMAAPNPAAIRDKLPCRNPSSQGESDLCAQWRAANAAEDSAFWAKWSFWVSVIASALLVWQIGLTRRAVEDTGNATNAMIEQNQLIAEVQRPWIQVDVSIGKGDWSEGRIRFPYYITIKNIGPVPGVCVSFRHKDSVCEENHFKTSAKMLVEMLKSCQQETEDNGGYVIMPQEERKIYCGWAAKLTPRIILDANGEPHMKICIGIVTAYKKSKSGDTWFTAKSYLVGIADDADPFIGDRIPISELRQISKRQLVARLDGWTKTT